MGTGSDLQRSTSVLQDYSTGIYMCVCERERDGEKERQRRRETERERDRHRETSREREREIHRQRKRESLFVRERESVRDREFRCVREREVAGRRRSTHGARLSACLWNEVAHRRRPLSLIRTPPS